MGLLDVLNGMQNGPRGPSIAKRTIRKRRRDVAHDDGDPGPAGLEAVKHLTAAKLARRLNKRPNCPVVM